MEFLRNHRLALLGLLLGIAFFLGDTAADAYLLGEARVVDSLLAPDAAGLWLRLAVLAVTLGFGLYGDILLARARRAAEAARLNEHFLVTLIENIPDMVCVRDARTLRMLRVNRAAERLLGVPRERLVGHTVAEVMDPEAAAALTALDGEALAGRHLARIEDLCLADRAGDERHIEMTKIPLLDAGGEPQFLMTLCQDRSAEHRTLAELTAAREQAELFLKLAETIVVGLDAEGRIELVNPHACAVFGYEPEQLLGRSWFETLLPAEEQEAVGEVFRRIMAGEIELLKRYDNHIVTRHGERRYISWRNALRRDPQGRIVGTLSCGQDITERKQVEDRLRQSAIVFQSTNDAVMVVDRDQRIVAVNPAFSRITGYSEQEAVGQHPSLLRSGRHDAGFYASLWQALRDEGHWKGEIWDRRRSGEAFPSWHSITAVSDDSGHTSHYIDIFSDITPIKQHQRHLEYLAHHDPLTHLPNRVLFTDRLTHALRRAAREERRIALLFLDLDRFKPINDAHGHALGDRVLQVVADRLQGLLRGEDSLCRLGGDEFLILIESASGEAALTQVAQRICDEIARPIALDAHTLYLGVSIGIAVGDGSSDPQTLIQRADQAMYRAKEDPAGNFAFAGSA